MVLCRGANMLRALLTFVCVALTAGLLHAESITVNGTVTSASDGEPLIGVSVIVVGTPTGTSTDINGQYSIKAETGQTLRFSYVGMTPQDIKVASDRVDVAMTDNATSLDEVVVVGYGVQKKKLVTGATSQIKGDNVAKMNTTNALQAMQGQAPGINITQASGQPGKGMKVSIRGLGTIGNSEPLYLIDGVAGDISNINPADIQSIDILKDAASAAIYGAQAANGVVLVTTKGGQEGRAIVNFDAYVGWQTAARKTKMLNAEEYMMIMDEMAVNSGDMPYDWSSYKSIWAPDGNINDTDWLDMMFADNALTQNYSVGISGGNAKSNYAISGGYTSAEGLIGGKDVSNFSRYNFRVNSQHKLFDDYITIGEHVTFVHTKARDMSDSGNGNNGNRLYSAFNASPLAPVYSDNGAYGSPFNNTASSDWNAGDGNPYGAMMTMKDKKSRTSNFNADVYAQVEPIKDLVVKTLFAVNFGNSSYRSYTPKYQFDAYTDKDKDYVNQSASDWYSYTWQNTASYRFDVKENEFTAMIGMEVGRSEGVNLSGQNASLNAGFQNWDKAYINNGTANATSDGLKVEGFPNPSVRNLSYFARLGWNYKERYMINATMRADGSSKFAKGHRWGYFPSVSAGWNLSNEAFMEDAFGGKLDFLKIRASWGRVGNNNIDAFQYLAPIIYAGHYTFGDGLGSTAPGYMLGAFMERLANEEIKWETSEQFNVGFDTRWLNSRLDFNFDFYIKNTKDWLVMAPILYTAGFGDNGPMINGGNVKNTGIELNATWHDNIGGFEYYVGANAAWNRNRVGEIPNKDGLIQGGKGILYNNCDYWYRAENGHAIGYFWGLQTDGLFQNEQEIKDWIAAGNGIAQSDPQPGDVKYVDQNHDGRIDEKDRVDLGNGIADWTFGFNFGFNYKNFDFGAVFTGQAGNKIVKSYRGIDGFQNNFDRSILNRWTGEGTSDRIPRVTKSTDNYLFSDLFVQDGDFLRISNVTVGYDFAKLINWKFVSKARLYFQIQNLYTFTKYDGMDPEIGNGDVSNGWVRGVDQGFYPRPRTYLVGVNVTF